MKLKRIEDAIEVVEWAIDHRKSMLGMALDSNSCINELHQLIKSDDDLTTPRSRTKSSYWVVFGN